MRDAFVPLEIALRPAVSDDRARQPMSQCESAAVVDDGSDRSLALSNAPDALAEARRFKAALADALELSLERLLCDVACDVVARELELAPCDVAAIAARALRRCFDEEPLRFRVHPVDVAALHGWDLPAVPDERLRAGDVVLELRCGSIDASLGARLESAVS